MLFSRGWLFWNILIWSRRCPLLILVCLWVQHGVWFTMCCIAKCFTKFEDCYSNPKVLLHKKPSMYPIHLKCYTNFENCYTNPKVCRSFCYTQKKDENQAQVQPERKCCLFKSHYIVYRILLWPHSVSQWQSHYLGHSPNEV